MTTTIKKLPDCVSLLLQGREKLRDPSRWTKRGFSPHSDDDDECLCALEAVHVCDGNHCDKMKAVEFLDQAVPDEFWTLEGGFPEGYDRSTSELHEALVYNDHPDITYADIITLYGDAIALARKAT